MDIRNFFGGPKKIEITGKLYLKKEEEITGKLYLKISKELEEKIRKEIEDQISKELEEKIRKELEEKIRKELEEEFREEILNIIKQIQEFQDKKLLEKINKIQCEINTNDKDIMDEYIYVMKSNNTESFKKSGYKIGKTTNPTKRLRHANGTFTPSHDCYKYVLLKKVKNNTEKERFIHKLLEDNRTDKNREFFNVDYKTIKNIFDLIDGELLISDC
jgi:hypothetical protein